MKTLFKILTGIVLVILLLVVVIKIKGDSYLLKGLWASYLHGNNSATIDDARFFNTHPIAAADDVWEWPESSRYNRQALPEELETVLTETQSVAFLVIQNDSLLTEHYWDNYSDSSQSNSFSMAKSITTMLAQIAIQKGVLTGWHQKVNTLLPGLAGKYAGELELWHLSTMSSGMQWDESYKNPFAVSAKAYYGDHIGPLMMQLPIVDQPGKAYNYQSGSTELLGMCVMKATGKSLAELAEEWLWKPLQAEYPAKWHTDADGTELAFCCFNSNARDFARFGKLMQNSGNWRGVQLLDSAFVQLAVQPALAPYYGYSFWLDNLHGTPVFYQRGILGQYIISIPEYHTIIVRLGKKRMDLAADNHSKDYHVIVEQVLGMVRGK